MSYEYQGDPLASRSMELCCLQVHSIGPEGVWFRGHDEEDMEVEVTVGGLTPDVVISALRTWDLLPDAKGVIDAMISGYLADREAASRGVGYADTGHGFRAILRAVMHAHGWPQDQADTWLCEELQDRVASRG